MRESLRRSHIRSLLVAPALMALGACAPQLPLNPAPPPCLPNYAPCPMTGACQPAVPGAPKDAPPMDCPDTLELRQGDHIVLPTPGVSRDAVTVTALDNDLLTATLGDAGAGVTVTAHHGAAAGDTFGGQKRFVTITENIPGHDPWVRSIPVIVTNIVAAPWGDNKNPGTFTRPFATLQAAIKVAGAGDTILLRNPPQPDNVSNGPSTGADPTAITIPADVTVRCPDSDLVLLMMPVKFAGNATLDTLSFEKERLVIDHKSSQVAFSNVKLTHGLTITSRPDEGPVTEQDHVEVSITANSQVFDDRQPTGTLQPVLVLANHAVVTIDGSGVKMTDDTANVEAIGVAADDVSLTISNGVELTNAAGKPALNVTGASTVKATGSKFMAPVSVSNPGADLIMQSSSVEPKGQATSAPVTFHGRDLTIADNSRLTNAPLTFGGRNLRLADTTIDGSNLVAETPPPIVQVEPGDSATGIVNVTFKSAPMTFQGGTLTIQGLTTFTDSLLTFRGKTLTATDATFVEQGIWQDSLDSSATLQNVQITNYTQWGYRLNRGQVRLVNSAFAHAASVVAKDALMPPWALLVQTPNDPEGSSVSSLGTTYDDQPFVPTPPLPCVAGPGAVAGVYYSMETQATISFCGPN